MANFILPKELTILIDSGIWPSMNSQINAQELTPLISRQNIQTVLPKENTIIFFPPPFYTISDRINKGEVFWQRPEAAIFQINPEKSLDIGDFGYGSDSALVLDYDFDEKSPRVIMLQWEDDIRKNKWIEISRTFGEFCHRIGLIK